MWCRCCRSKKAIFEQSATSGWGHESRQSYDFTIWRYRPQQGCKHIDCYLEKRDNFCRRDECTGNYTRGILWQYKVFFVGAQIKVIVKHSMFLRLFLTRGCLTFICYGWFVELYWRVSGGFLCWRGWLKKWEVGGIREYRTWTFIWYMDL